jgi:arylsulfatase A-like enzyme
MATPRITRRRFVQGVVAGSALAAACDVAKPPRDARPPNIIIIVTDDQRADSTGFGGAPIATPALDSLAASSTVFENAFVTTSVCACSRASLLSGQYMRRHGIHDFGQAFAQGAIDRSYPVRLRAAGYHTGFIGKWGLSGDLPADSFDVFEGFGGQGTYFHTRADERRHLSALLAERSSLFVDQAPAGRPFCLSVSFKAPHGPWQEYDPAFENLAGSEKLSLPASASLEAADGLPRFLRESLGAKSGREWVANPELLRAQLLDYHRLVAGIDAGVEQILEAVARRGEPTAILYTSDNGVLIGEHGLVGKWLMFEESIRVPMLLKMPEDETARRLQEPVLNVDVAPTVLDLAGIPVPRGPRGMQGVSFARLARDGPSREWRRDWFYEHDLDLGRDYLPKLEGVREQRWKYVRYLDPQSNSEALYDLANDPLELTNLAGEAAHAAPLKRLRKRWKLYRKLLA